MSDDQTSALLPLLPPEIAAQVTPGSLVEHVLRILMAECERHGVGQRRPQLTDAVRAFPGPQPASVVSLLDYARQRGFVVITGRSGPAGAPGDGRGGGQRYHLVG